MEKNTKVKTYNPRQLIVTVGNKAISGFAEDSFLTIEEKGNGVVSKTGCDGEVARAVDPTKQYTINLTLLQMSDSNSLLHKYYMRDKADGQGVFPITIKSITNDTIINTNAAWVVKEAVRTFGRETNNRQWTIETGESNIQDDLGSWATTQA